MPSLEPEIIACQGTKFEFNPSERQAEFISSLYKFHEVLYGGAYGGGKTRGFCEGAFALATAPGFWPNRIFLCRKDGIDFERTVLEPELLDKTIHSRCIRSHNQKLQRITLTNGSEIWYGGASDIEKIQGPTFGAVGIDQIEQISFEAYVTFLSRLRLAGVKNRVIFGTANPAPGWCKDRFIPPGGTQDTFISGERIYIPARIKDNPGLSTDYEQRLRREHDPIWVRRYIEGDWSSFSGAVYSIPGECIKPRSELYRVGEYVYLGVDFGFRRAAVCWIQPRGEALCVIDELAVENCTTEELGRRAKERSQKAGYHMKGGFSDPAGAARNVQTGISDMETFSKASGIRVLSPGNKVLRDVVLGVQRVQSRIANKGLLIARECAWFLTCIENYCYPDHHEGHDLKEEPKKDGLHDHMMDCYRYFEIGWTPPLRTRVNY